MMVKKILYLVGVVIFMPTLTYAVTLVSVNHAGDSVGNALSKGRLVTQDGRFVVFDSTASDLVADDNNSFQDVFIRDTHNNTTKRVSLNFDKNDSDGDSTVSAVSADGRYVLFSSDAQNITHHGSNGRSNIFLRDINANTTTLISMNKDEKASNNSSHHPIMTPDGRYIVFTSAADDLVENDTNGYIDIFLKDMQNNTLVRINLTDTGGEANHYAIPSAITPDGRYVLFTSEAYNLVSGQDNNIANDVFVRDIIAGTTTLVSKGIDGYSANASSSADGISDDGRYIFFNSYADNIVESDRNGQADLFVKDMHGNTTTRINLNAQGEEANNMSMPVYNFHYGRYVVFNSYADNLVPNDTNGTLDVFVKDLQNKTIQRVSTDADGNEGNGESYVADISDDGRYVFFYSDATNLVIDDTNKSSDIFVKSMQSGEIVRINLKDDGGQIENEPKITDVGISKDGRYVIISTVTSDLFADDDNSTSDVFLFDNVLFEPIVIDEDEIGKTELISINHTNTAPGNSESDTMVVSQDGRYIAFNSDASDLVADDTNGTRDVFVRDTTLNTTVRVSVDTKGNDADGPSGVLDLSADGRYILFNSDASNLVGGDFNGTQDVFVRDVINNTTIRVSTTENSENAGNNASAAVSITPDGRYVLFTSDASDLVVDDTNNIQDIFLKDILNNQTVRVNLDYTEDKGDESFSVSTPIQMSEDGRYVLFDSDDDSLVDNDTNGATDVFVRDVQERTTIRVSTNSDNQEANSSSVGQKMSRDGKKVLFQSDADNLVQGDTNYTRDFFIKDIETGITTRANVTNDGYDANDNVLYEGATDDLRYVMFYTRANNMIENDTNGQPEVFIRDTLNNTTIRASTDKNGMELNGYSELVAMSSDGRFIVFYSDATNFVSDDTNDNIDLFVKDMQTNFVWMGSLDSEGNQLNTKEKIAGVVIAGDGGSMFFSTKSDKYANNDTNDSMDIFMYKFAVKEQQPIQAIDLISINKKGDAPGNQYSLGTIITPDGRYVLFDSDANDLVANDTNDATDVFVRDRDSKITIRISVNDSDNEGNGISRAIDITPDGRYILFYSNSDNLVGDDINEMTDLFVRDTVNRTTLKVNSGEISDRRIRGSYGAAFLTDDGRYVYFNSPNANVEEDQNGVTDVYKTDIIKQIVSRVSTDEIGNELLTGSLIRTISEDGRHVLYQTLSEQGDIEFIERFKESKHIIRQTTFGNIFMKSNDGVQMINVDDEGKIISNLVSDVFMSNDGRYVGFQQATEAGVRGRIQQAYLYVKDAVNGSLKTLYHNSEGRLEPIKGRMLAMSNDGRYVIFMSADNNLVVGDEDDNWNIFRIDMDSYTIIPITLPNNGDDSGVEQEKKEVRQKMPKLPGHSVAVDTTEAYISADSNLVVFSTIEDNIVPDDNNGVSDVFVKDILNNTIQRVSVNGRGEEPDDSSVLLGISDDGSKILFDGYGSNLVSNDTNDDSDVFVAIYDFEPSSIVTISYPVNESYVLESENLIVSGLGYPGAEIELTHEKDVYQVFVDSKGNWSVELPGKVFEGTHSLAVRQKLPNVTTYGGTITSRFYADRTQPDAPIINDPVENDLVQGSGEPGLLLTLSIGGYPEFTGIVGQDGHWEFDISGLPFGEYKVEAQQIDLAGLESKWSNQVWFSRVDTIVIDMPVITAPTSGQVLAGKNVDISGLGTAGYNIHIEIDGVIYDGTVDNNGQRTLTVPSGAVGLHIAHVWQDNGLGIHSESNHVSYIIAAPTVSVPTIVVPIGGTLFKSNDITVSGTGTNGYTLHLQLSGAHYTGRIDNHGSWSIPVYKINNGYYTIVAWQTDSFGNRGMNAEVSFFVGITESIGNGFGGGKGPGSSSAGTTSPSKPVVVPPVKEPVVPIKEVDTSKPITPVVTIPESHPPTVVAVTPTTPNIAIKEAIVQTSHVSAGSMVEVKTVQNSALQTEKKCYTPKEVVDITLGKQTTHKDLLVYQALLKSYDLTIFTDTDKYMPENGLKRMEAAKMFTNFAKHILCRESVQTYTGTTTYTDIADVDPTLRPYIIQAYEYGILRGSNNQFRPLDRITRKEFVAALMRMFINSNLDIQDAGNNWDANYQVAFKEYGLESIVAVDEEIDRYAMSKIMYKLYYNTSYQWTDKGYVLPYGKK